MHSQTRAMRCIIGAAAAICTTWFATQASAVQDVQLTTVRGDARLADVPLTGRGELSEDQDLMTGDDGNASVLLDRNAVVELCGHSQVRFTRNESTGVRIVNIQAGDVKLIVEPRHPGERIEIHTPAAIATILGTVVYVSVDPVTGATTISSSQSQVNIRSRGEAATTAGTTISAYEQLTIVPGQQRQQKQSVSPKQIAALTSCLLDFHDMAVEIDRVSTEDTQVEKAVIADVSGADLPPIETGRPAGPTVPTDVGNTGGGGGDPDLIDPTDTQDETVLMPVMEESMFRFRGEEDR